MGYNSVADNMGLSWFL